MLSSANYTTLTQILPGNNRLWVAGENQSPFLQIPYGVEWGGCQVFQVFCWERNCFPSYPAKATPGPCLCFIMYLQLLCKCFQHQKYFWLGLSLIKVGARVRPMQSTSPVGDVGWQHVGTTPLLSDETRSEGSVRWTFPGNLKTVTGTRRRRSHFPGNGGLSSMHSMLLSQRNPIWLSKREKENLEKDSILKQHPLWEEMLLAISDVLWPRC